jgi:YVTN family beta-propeller protein
VPIGKNPEFMRMQPDGAKAYVTFEPSSTGKPPGKGEKDEGDGAPAEVAAIDLRTWTAKSFLTGGRETEGIEFSPDGKRLSVANEGDDTVTSYDKSTGKLVQTVDLHSLGSRPRGIKVSPDGTRYVVTMENSDTLVVLDATLKVEKTLPVAKGPYGVAFDRSGQRLFVAAARAKTLQAFDARTFQKLADIPVGDRCWHFSFTPDEAYLLVACGRSNELRIVDAKTYRPVKSITGLKLAWGVVTYPKANGSLDAR